MATKGFLTVEAHVSSGWLYCTRVRHFYVFHRYSHQDWPVKMELICSMIFIRLQHAALFLVLHYLTLAENWSRLTWIRHSSRKSSATHSYQCVRFCVSRQWYGYQCLGLLTCSQCWCIRGLYGHRKRVCTESWPWEKNPLPDRGLEPASVLPLAFQSGALPAELSPLHLHTQVLYRHTYTYTDV